MERPSSFGFCKDYTHAISFKEVFKYDIGSVNSLWTVYCSTKWIAWSFLAISFKLLGSIFNIWKARKALCASLLPVNMSVPDTATNNTSETVTYLSYISLEWILSFLSPQNNISFSYPRAWFSRASNKENVIVNTFFLYSLYSSELISPASPHHYSASKENSTRMWDQFTSINEDDMLRTGLLVEIKLKQTLILLLVLKFRVIHELCSHSESFSPCITCSQVTWHYCGSMHNTLPTPAVAASMSVFTDRTAEWLRLERTSEDYLVQPPAQAGTHRTHYPGLRTVVSEYLQERRSHWAACFITPSSSKELNFSSCTVRTSCISFWDCCFSSYYGAPLRRV